MIEKPEYILCAAIWMNDEKIYPYQPDNIPSGYVLSGHRHHCIFQQLVALSGNRKGNRQGFLTSKNRFVDRVEAVDVAFKAGQIERKKLALFSEDIY